MCISSYLSSIPDVVWSGVIASFLTLSGVMLSNLSNTNRLRLQLQHESDEGAKQRKADLRKEVYLQAAEELVKANAYLGSLPQTDFAKVNIGGGMQGFLVAAAKLQMIAESSTSLLMGDLVGTYNELFLKIVAKALPIQNLQIDIGIRDEHLKKAQSEVSRVLAAMTQYNESATNDPAIFDALNNSFEFFQEQVTKFTVERDDLMKRKHALALPLTKEIVNELKAVGEQGMHVLIAIRQEIDVGGNTEQFLEQMEKQWKKVSKQFDAVLNSLEENMT